MAASTGSSARDRAEPGPPSEDELHEFAENRLGMDTEHDDDLLWIAKQAFEAPLPKPWRRCTSGRGETFYFNGDNGESTWDHPDEDRLRELYLRERARKIGSPGSRSADARPLCASAAVSLPPGLPTGRFVAKRASSHRSLRPTASEPGPESAEGEESSGSPKAPDLSDLLAQPLELGREKAESPAKGASLELSPLASPVPSASGAEDAVAALLVGIGGSPAEGRQLTRQGRLAQTCTHEPRAESQAAARSAPAGDAKHMEGLRDEVAGLREQLEHWVSRSKKFEEDLSSSARHAQELKTSQGRLREECEAAARATEEARQEASRSAAEATALRNQMLEYKDLGLRSPKEADQSPSAHRGSALQGTRKDIAGTVLDDSSPPTPQLTSILVAELKDSKRSPTATAARAGASPEDGRSGVAENSLRWSCLEDAPLSARSRDGAPAGSLELSSLTAVEAHCEDIQPIVLDDSMTDAQCAMRELQRVGCGKRSCQDPAATLRQGEGLDKGDVLEETVEFGKTQPQGGLEAELARTMARGGLFDRSKVPDSKPRKRLELEGPSLDKILEKQRAMSETERSLQDVKLALHKEQTLHSAARGAVTQSQREAAILRGQLSSKEAEAARLAEELRECRSELAAKTEAHQRLLLEAQERDGELSRIRRRRAAESHAAERQLDLRRAELERREAGVEDRERFVAARERVVNEARLLPRAQGQREPRERERERAQAEVSPRAQRRGSARAADQPQETPRRRSAESLEAARASASSGRAVFGAAGSPDSPVEVGASPSTASPSALTGSRTDLTERSPSTASDGLTELQDLGDTVRYPSRSSSVPSRPSDTELLRQRKRDLRAEYAALEEDRRQWHTDVRRASRRGSEPVGGILAQVRSELDSRTSALNQAIVDYRSLERLLSKPHGSGRARSSVAPLQGSSNREGTSRSRATAQEQDLLRRWQHVLPNPPKRSSRGARRSEADLLCPLRATVAGA